MPFQVIKMPPELTETLRDLWEATVDCSLCHGPLGAEWTLMTQPILKADARRGYEKHDLRVAWCCGQCGDRMRDTVFQCMKKRGANERIWQEQCAKASELPTKGM